MEAISDEIQRPIFGHLTDCVASIDGLRTYPHIVYRPVDLFVPTSLTAPASFTEHATEIGSWPKRLLHVTTMTVHEWRPGNRYGQWKAPSYNAICYTWGRQRKSSMKRRMSIPHIEFKNVPWSCASIDPKHFTVAELENVIRQASEHAHMRTDFVWIDVACIDPEFDISRDLEAGRTVEIMRGAGMVYVWLTSKTKPRLSSIWSMLQDATEASRIARPRSNMEWMSWALAAICELVSDPWFGSLWTLQEAAVCREAAILSREGKTITSVRKDQASGSHSILRLEGLYVLCTTIQDACQRLTTRNSSRSGEALMAKKILNWIEISGLSALSCANAIALYSATKYRRSKKDWNFVYAMQQVFGYQLGIYAVDADRNAIFTHGQLEEHLGAELLRHRPLFSQCHVFTERVSHSRGWRFNTSSLAVADIAGSFSSISEYKACFSGSVVPIGGRLWGRFSGEVSDFAKLQRKWACSYADTKSHSSEHVAKVIFDATEFKVIQPEWPYAPYTVDTKILAEHVDFVDKNSVIIVLRIGKGKHAIAMESERKKTTSGEQTLGLILLQRATEGFEYWTRIGLCFWLTHCESSEPASSSENLRGDSLRWQHMKGVFG